MFCMFLTFVLILPLIINGLQESLSVITTMLYDIKVLFYSKLLMHS